MSYIRTQQNRKFNYLDIQNNIVTIEEIASVLSKIPRWLGHTDNFYSVAQHCCWCYDNTKGNKLEALMHDASEAYLGDCPTPLKKLLPEFNKLENQISILLSNTFDYKYPYSKETHNVDNLALGFERYNIKKLNINYEPFDNIIPNIITYWKPKQAEKNFLKRYYNE